MEGFAAYSDQVFAMADNTHAELCVVKAAVLAKVPKGLDLIQAAALPLVTITGNQLLVATPGIKAGQDGSGGRCCWKCWAFGGIHCEAARGATVIAGVLKRQVVDAEDRRCGPDGRNRRRRRDGAESLRRSMQWRIRVGGRTAEKLIAEVKPGGVNMHRLWGHRRTPRSIHL